MIELIGLVKRFGNLVAVDDVSLTVASGEFFAVLGPNAAGKTTTLKMLAGLLKPTAGNARVGGFDLETHPMEARRLMAFVPDFPFLYDKLTPWEFLRFVGQLFRMGESEIRRSSSELIERFKLDGFIDKHIDTLSHGTRQRVAIAAALLHQPRVLVMDEPMVGLDPQHARTLKDTLRERAQAGVTVLVSTHQLSVAEELADRIGIMHQGRLVAVGSADELRHLSGTAGPLEEVFLSLTAGRSGNGSVGNL
jgi:ABC-2 type transport system ATP-binding protein